MLLTHARSCAAVLSLLALLLPAGLALGQEHRLSFERQRPVGGRYQVVVQGQQGTTMTQRLNGRQLGEEKTEITGAMTAVAEVLAVHENKQVRSLALTIEQFTGDINGQSVELDKAKRIIVTAVDGDATYAYEDGTAINEEAAQVLDVLARFMVEEKPDGESDNAMFKLDRDRAIGSTWTCDNGLIAKDISAGGELAVDEEDVESVFSFIDVAEFAGEQAAVFDVTITLKGLEIPGAAQQGVVFTRSLGEMKMSGLLPLDPRSGSGALQVQMQMNVTGEVAIPDNGGKLVVDFQMSADANAEYREINDAN